MEKFEINNIETTLIKTDKFKTITVFVVFFGEFNKENATKRSLLSRIMSNTTKLYPTKKLVANKLFDLYDAGIFVNSFPIHKANLTVFGLNIVNPKFVNDDGLLNEAFSFLKEFIFNPNFDDNGFDINEFNENKRIIRDNINNIYNNKTLYAFNRLLAEMGPNEIISVSSLGTIEELDKITPVSLTDFYYKTINNEMVKLFITGDINKEQLITLFNDFKFNANNVALEPYSQLEHRNLEAREVIEEQNINQTQLMMGFRSNINAMDDLYIPMALFNMMFGGMVSSDLFRVVREENSLAYSVSSNIFFDNRIIIVNAGIAASDYQKTKDLVIQELERYKQGNISSDLLQVAKDNLISSMMETADDPFSNLTFIIKNSLLKNYTTDDLISLINDVTLDEVIAASRKVELDVIYCLRGEENGNN